MRLSNVRQRLNVKQTHTAVHRYGGVRMAYCAPSAQTAHRVGSSGTVCACATPVSGSGIFDNGASRVCLWPSTKTIPCAGYCSRLQWIGCMEIAIRCGSKMENIRLHVLIGALRSFFEYFRIFDLVTFIKYQTDWKRKILHINKILAAHRPIIKNPELKVHARKLKLA